MSLEQTHVTRRSAPLSIPDRLRLDRIAERARAEHDRRARRIALHKARVEKAKQMQAKVSSVLGISPALYEELTRAALAGHETEVS